MNFYFNANKLFFIVFSLIKNDPLWSTLPHNGACIFIYKNPDNAHTHFYLMWPHTPTQPHAPTAHPSLYIRLDGAAYFARNQMWGCGTPRVGQCGDVGFIFKSIFIRKILPHICPTVDQIKIKFCEQVYTKKNCLKTSLKKSKMKQILS